MKLSLHADLWNGQVTENLKPTLDKGAGWAKFVNSPDVAYGWATSYPNKRFVYRKAEPSDLQNLSDWMKQWPDPIVCADVVARYNDIAPAKNLYVEGINEAKIDSYTLAMWFGRHEAARSRMLRAKGLTAVIGNFATGAILPEHFAEFVRTYKAEGGDPNALMGLHAYGKSPNLDSYNMLAYRKLRAAAGNAFLWVLTEVGCDIISEGGGSWREQGLSEDQYWDYLLKFNAELEKDPWLLAAFVFTYNGTSRWQNYELRNAPVFNKRLLEAQVARTYTRGIDVSSYQTKLTDFAAAKRAGIEFAFIRNTDGINTPDAQFARNWALARGNVLRGQYIYLRYNWSGKTQAEFMLSRADKNDYGELPMVVDVEQYAPSPAGYAAVVREAVQTLEAATKKKPIIYTGRYQWAEVAPYCAWAKDYPLWIAAYPYGYSTVPSLTTLQAGNLDPANVAPFGRWKFWQYSSIGFVDGIGYPVDLDVFDGDLLALQEFAGMTIPTPVQPYTGQNWINDVFEAGVALKYPNDKIVDWLITRAGITITPTFRTQPYSGPALTEINWSAQEIAAFKAAGGKDNR